eukprot:GHVU01079058.1.p1 GENE.GHVU01079058.1~~GHVU01079058.1.p1  ORF type:complete len:311 (-),score=46.14 GHVU01079058.1:287-1219(-)
MPDTPSMKIWFDTEFVEDGHTIDLISIGMVREDGAAYYAECAEFDPDRAGDWVARNVLPHLTGEAKPRVQIAREIAAFAGERPEFWAYYADYDWVALCQLYGTMMDLPKGWPMYCRDLKQWADMLGGAALPPQDTTEHHALNDAQWTRAAWEHLSLLATPSRPADDAVERVIKRIVQRIDAASSQPFACEADVEEAEEIVREELAALFPAPSAPAAGGWEPTHRHVKRGTTYRVLGEAEAQVSTGDYRAWPKGNAEGHGPVARLVHDGVRLTVYQGEDGKLWVRFPDEFADGRFATLPAPPASPDSREDA